MRPLEDRLRLIAVASIGVAVLVLAIKYLAYRRTGSVALLSDALESIVNVATAFIALWAVHVSGKPADLNHPFGHHKVEYFSAVFTGVMIVLAALLILKEAWGALLAPQPPRAPFVGLAYSGLATILNAGWSGLLILTGRRWRSPALAADGWHLMTDVATSVGVLVGFGLVAVTGWLPLDPLTAIAVALNILWSGWGVMRNSVSGLMDESLAPDVLAEVRKLISAEAKGALEVHDLRTRHAGRATFIEFHMVVPGDMSVRAAHDICDRIEASLKAKFEGASVLIHVEPEEKAKHNGVPVL
jgi:cation diffusion facilitator family transporter